MFSKDEISKAIGKVPIISSEMTQHIDLWMKMYRGEAPWIDNYVKSIQLEQGICREFADTALSEIDVKVTNQTLNDLLHKSLDMLTENLISGLASGSFCLKPIGKDIFEFVTADKFFPLEFSDDGSLIAVVFVSTKEVGDKYYRRLELHELTKTGLHISNTAFVSKNGNDIGRQCNLEEISQWAKLIPDITYPVNKMDFGFYKNPIQNDVDYSLCGISLYHNACELIKKADIQFARLDWEFESGERIINVSETALRPTLQVGIDGKQHYAIPKLNQRLYHGINVDSGDKDFYEEHSPNFRETNIINGLEQIKRAIEFTVGLAYGDLSNTQDVEKTATEIKHAKQRKYNRVNAIEKKLSKCLEDFCYGLAFYNGLTKSGYKFNCTFSDSILSDEETERKQDQQDLANGTLRPEEYRAKWRNEDINTALKNLPQTEEVTQ